MNKFIAIPACYEGTSFEDIMAGISVAAKNIGLQYIKLGCDEILHNTLQSGKLDDNNFERYQSMIIEDFIKYVPDNSRVLFLDMFMPGLDIIKYHLERNSLEVEMGALLHGGQFLHGDLYHEETWLKPFEDAYFETFKVLYSPSKYLKSCVPDKFKPRTRIFPWGLDHFSATKRDDAATYDVIFPHRLAVDKGIDDLLEIARQLPNICFYVTTASSGSASEEFELPQNVKLLCNISTEEHHSHLVKSKIVLSCAKQENFGYAVHKAVASGCIPVLPNKLCYPEFFPKDFLYDSIPEAIEMIDKYAKNTILKQWQSEVNKTYSFQNLLIDFFYD